LRTLPREAGIPENFKGIPPEDAICNLRLPGDSGLAAPFLEDLLKARAASRGRTRVPRRDLKGTPALLSLRGVPLRSIMASSRRSLGPAMDELKITVPELSQRWKEEAFSSFERLMFDIFSDGFRSGYLAGRGDTVQRMMDSLQGTAEQEVISYSINSKTDWQALGKERGARTHKVVQSVLSKVGPAGATPQQITAHSANKDPKISRQAIAKVLRRGVKAGRYVNLGGGRYSLKGG